MQQDTIAENYTSTVEIALGISILDSDKKIKDIDSEFRICLLKDENDGKFSLPTREVTKKLGCLDTLETMVYDWVILQPEAIKQTILQDVLDINMSEEFSKNKERKVMIVYTLFITNKNHHILEDRLVPLTVDEFSDLIFSKESKFKPHHHEAATAAFIKQNHGRQEL